MTVPVEVPFSFIPAILDGEKLCPGCSGHSVRWVVEKEPTGKNSDGSLYRRGWMEKCPTCDGEGCSEKKKAIKVDFHVGKSLTISQKMIPYNFARNTPENIAWKLGTNGTNGHASESAWLASNGVLLVVHGGRGCPEVLERTESQITPSVEAKYYAWLCPGVLTGPHVDLVIDALREYNAGSEI